MSTQATRMGGDLSTTALYTSQVWRWAGFRGAELFDSRPARGLFRVVNAAHSGLRLVERDVPPLAENLAQRHAMIDYLQRQSGAEVVLEIAAGLSQRGVALSADPACLVVEVDLPRVIARKRELLRRSEAGRAAARRENLRFYGGDVRELDLTALVPAGRPCFAIAEGLLMYFDESAQRDFWARLAALLRRSKGTLVFDLIRAERQPPPGRVNRALHGILARATGGGGILHDGRSREQILCAIREAGFDRAEVFDSADVATEWDLPFAGAPTRVEIFQASIG